MTGDEIALFGIHYVQAEDLRRPFLRRQSKQQRSYVETEANLGALSHTLLLS